MGIAPNKDDQDEGSQINSDRDPYAPAQFTAGSYYGISTKDKRDKIVECFKPNDRLTNFLYAAFDEYIAGNKMAGDAYLARTKPLYRRALRDCGNISDHIHEWTEKLDDLQERDDWPKVAKQIYEANKAVIDRDIDLEIKQWKEGVYFNSGMFAGQVGKVFLDNAPQSETSRSFMSDTTRDTTAPAQFAAGWYYGVTSIDKRDDILDCFASSDDLTNDLYDAMEAYIAGDSQEGDKKMKDSKLLWDTAMANCGETAVAMGKISREFDEIQARSDWDKVSKEIYMANKDVIDRDIGLELSQWTDGVFFNSGMFAG